MGLTTSILNRRQAAIFPTYGSGDIDAAEFNRITAEIAASQQYMVKNWNLLGFVNVLDYSSVVADGYGNFQITSTDVNNAITASGNKNVILIPANVMVCCDSGPIILPSKKTLLGGALFGTPSLSGPMYPGSNVTCIYSTNGTDCVQCNSTSNGGTGIAGIFFGDYQHYCVGIRLATGNTTWLNDGWIKDCWFARASIYAANVQGWILSRSVFDWTSGPELDMYGCENWRISQNYFALSGQGYNNSAAVQMAPLPANGHRSICNAFVGNIFCGEGMQGTGTTTHCVSLNNTEGCVFNGNLFDQSTGRGIWLQGGSSNATIVGNQFAKLGAEGIYLDGCNNVNITGNDFNAVVRNAQDTNGVIPTENNVPHIRLVNTNTKILMTSLTMSSQVRTTGIELSAGSTKCRWDNIMTDGSITTPVSDLNGTNSAGTVIS
jgi:hypothetical protein